MPCDAVSIDGDLLLVRAAVGASKDERRSGRRVLAWGAALLRLRLQLQGNLHLLPPTLSAPSSTSALMQCHCTVIHPIHLPSSSTATISSDATTTGYDDSGCWTRKHQLKPKWKESELRVSLFAPCREWWSVRVGAAGPTGVGQRQLSTGRPAGKPCEPELLGGGQGGGELRPVLRCPAVLPAHWPRHHPRGVWEDGNTAETTTADSPVVLPWRRELP